LQVKFLPMGAVSGVQGKAASRTTIEINCAYGDCMRHKPNGLYVGGHLTKHMKSKITYRPYRSGAPAPAVYALGRVSPSREPPRKDNLQQQLGRGAGKATEGRENGLPDSPLAIYARSG
jgi:hypothetical protein